MRQFTPKQLMVPMVIGLTLVHLGFRWSARNDAQPMHVSPIEPGAYVPLGQLGAHAIGLEPETCLQVIVFMADCPFCQRAADRENKGLTADSRESRLWFTDTETVSLPYFISEHLHRQAAISAELVRTLKIQAVPALFVLRPDGEVRWVGSYLGTETDQELAERCTAERNQQPRT